MKISPIMAASEKTKGLVAIFRKTMTRLYLAFLIVLVGCLQNRQVENEVNNAIVIVNYGFASRSDFALGIKNISRCRPKLIGINALFMEEQGASDHTLAEEIESAENVILASNMAHSENSLIRSSSIFTSGCLGEGVVNFGLEKDVVTAYKPYTRLDWSFPITVVSFANPERGRELIKTTMPNRFYKIPKNDERFHMINIQETQTMDCSLIQDKIVLMGFLGPEQEDFLITPDDQEEDTFTYKTVILANIISDLLENNPQK